MSILRDRKFPALPLALGLVMSTIIALQPSALPVLAQGEFSEDAGAPQIGGVMAFGGGDIEAVSPQFIGVLTPQTGEAFAVGSGEGHEGHHHHGFSEANKMTDDQYERLYAIHEDVQDQMGLKKAQAGILRRKLRDVLSASSIDSKAAQDIAGKITALKSEMTQLHLDAMIKAAQVFTPEQRHELRMMMIKGQHHGHGHHGWGHGGPGGPGGHGGPCGHEGHDFHGPSHEHHGEMGK
jgi:Spy/CpxP family protein refolding chaperone